ncbi:DUF1365 domain-containing protein [Shimia thalassica]|uniref:DUF1365 domain-containing protein n=1 Tax=Shimia thalassica TaxID=1715693 RepID=UPI0026E1D6CB|nr:DUF1365 domain-containing protein [Shimia thalassica]MDO6479468.1 DUF1365 domain-containing protein [Shimia thalassica]
MTFWPEHIAGTTTHIRKGAVGHRFTYGIDYVLIDPTERQGPALFSRNRFNLASVHDRNHGGTRGDGRGLAWAIEVFTKAGLAIDGDKQVLLLTQPTVLGHVFNPVSFWIAMQNQDVLAVIAEVNNTFGDRHSYLCHLPEFDPLTPEDQIEVQKVFHVSPFQKVAGTYSFRFDIRPSKIAIHIKHGNGSEGVIATLSGKRSRLGNLGLLWSGIRRPAWAIRILALIHWQALILKLKGAPFTPRPTPPKQEVSS